MPFKPHLSLSFALLCAVAVSPAGAADVYKCGGKHSVTYTEKPCVGWMVDTQMTGQPRKRVPQQAKDVDVRRIEENRFAARVLRRKPGETDEQYETRRRRARLLATDRAECERLDKRIPVEETSLKIPDKDEIQRAEAGLAEARKRYAELRC